MQEAEPMKIAMLAPPWIPVPPPTYGGIELVVDLLSTELLRQGHEMTLFCSPGSKAFVPKVHPLVHAYPNKINNALLEVSHIGKVLDYVKKDGRFDLIHDHTSTAIAFARRCSTPIVHTMHNGHEGERGEFYRSYAADVALVAISDAQKKTAPSGLDPFVVHNPFDVEGAHYRPHKEPYALWVGRFVPEKGAHRAIKACQIAGVRLILAGPTREAEASQYFAKRISPHIDDDRVRYVGAVGGSRKQQLFARAAVLLMPIKWNEPFGMVMVEALAAGTPVLAFPYGAATEIVQDGINGHHVEDVPSMAEAMLDLQDIHPEICRETVMRFRPAKIVEQYVQIYEECRE